MSSIEVVIDRVIHNHGEGDAGEVLIDVAPVQGAGGGLVAMVDVQRLAEKEPRDAARSHVESQARWLGSVLRMGMHGVHSDVETTVDCEGAGDGARERRDLGGGDGSARRAFGGKRVGPRPGLLHDSVTVG